MSDKPFEKSLEEKNSVITRIEEGEQQEYLQRRANVPEDTSPGFGADARSTLRILPEAAQAWAINNRQGTAAAYTMISVIGRQAPVMPTSPQTPRGRLQDKVGVKRKRTRTRSVPLSCLARKTRKAPPFPPSVRESPVVVPSPNHNHGI